MSRTAYRTVTSHSGRKYTLDERHRRQPGTISEHEIRRIERSERARWSAFCDVWSEIGWRASR